MATGGITPGGLQRIIDAGITAGVLKPGSTPGHVEPQPEYVDHGGGAYERRGQPIAWPDEMIAALDAAQPDLYDDDPEDDRGYLPHQGIVVCDYRCGAPEEPDPDDVDQLRAAIRHWRSHGVAGGCSHGS